MMISDIITEKSRCWFNANPGDDHFIKTSQRNYGCKKSIGLFLSLGSLFYHQCYHPHVPDSLSEYLSKLSEVSLQNQIYFPLFSLILWYSFSRRASLSLSSKPKIKMCLIISSIIIITNIWIVSVMIIIIINIWMIICRTQIFSPSYLLSPLTCGSTSSRPISPSRFYYSHFLTLGMFDNDDCDYKYHHNADNYDHHHHHHNPDRDSHGPDHHHHHCHPDKDRHRWFSARVRSRWGKRSDRMMRRGSVWQGRAWKTKEIGTQN